MIADAIGLSVYSIVGTYLAEESGKPAVVAVVMGTLTGTAGGVLRDMLCNDVPILFREGYFYATAAIVGASVLRGHARRHRPRNRRVFGHGRGRGPPAGVDRVPLELAPIQTRCLGVALKESPMRLCLVSLGSLRHIARVRRRPRSFLAERRCPILPVATKANDVETAKRCWMIDDDNASGALDVVVGMWVASRKLVAATDAKFGADGVKLLGRWNRPTCTDKAIELTWNDSRRSTVKRARQRRASDHSVAAGRRRIGA